MRKQNEFNIYSGRMIDEREKNTEPTGRNKLHRKY